jgi:ABC-2 type transport system permease protein
MNRLAVLGAYFRRDMATLSSYRLTLALELALSMLNIALFYVLGTLVDRHDVSTGPALTQGYFSFAVIGIVVLGMLQVEVGTISVSIRNEQTAGTFEALLTAPISPSLMAGATGVFEAIKAAAIAVLQLILAGLFFGLQLQVNPVSAMGGLAAFLAGGCVFLGIGVVVGATVIVFKRTAALVGVIGIGLALVGGALYPVETLPGWLQTLALLNPLALVLDAIRTGLLDGGVSVVKLSILVGEAAVLIPLSLWMFGRAVEHGRRAGTITHY